MEGKIGKLRLKKKKGAKKKGLRAREEGGV